MAGNLWRCFAALGCLGFAHAAEAGSDKRAVTGLAVGEREDVLAGFVVSGGGELVSVVPAGIDPDAITFGKRDRGGRQMTRDPVSRLVTFAGEWDGISERMLAGRAPEGGVLAAAGNGGVARIGGRLTEYRGRFLPFSMLRVHYDEAIPRPGTPLLDASGKVAAVHYQGTGASAGLAIPVEVLGRVLAGIRAHGEATRAWVGLAIDPANREPRVTRVIDGSPADRGGLRAGDLLLEACGRKIGSYGEAVNALFFMMPGEPTEFRVRRGGAELELTVVPARAGP